MTIPRAEGPVGERSFPISAGILFGLGLGGVFDGIVLHQLLQWHHMLSNWYPVDTIENLKLNTLWDGIFHSSTFCPGRPLHSVAARSSTAPVLVHKIVIGTILIGFGAFNLVEGLINHQLLGIHHVNELVPRDQWLAWDVGFIVGCGNAGCRMDADERRATRSFMIRDIKEGAIYAVFALAALFSTLPAWRVPLIGLNPKLDQVLAAGCLY